MTLEHRPAATFPFGSAPPVDCQDVTEMVIAETAGLCGSCAIHALPEIVAALDYAVHVDLRRLDLQERADCPRCKGDAT